VHDEREVGLNTETRRYTVKLPNLNSARVFGNSSIVRIQVLVHRPVITQTDDRFVSVYEQAVVEIGHRHLLALGTNARIRPVQTSANMPVK